MKPRTCPVPWCVEHDDEDTHMSAVIDLPGGWSLETAQMDDETIPALNLTDPRGLVHAALVPGLTPDDAIRFGAALLNAGLAALPQKHAEHSISEDPTNCR